MPPSPRTPILPMGPGGWLARVKLPFPGLVFLLSLSMTLAFWHLYASSHARSARRTFEEAGDDIQQRILRRMQDNEQVLRGAVGLFDASQDVSRDEWRRYVAALKLSQNHPGIQGVGFAAWLTPHQVDACIRQTRAQGFPEFTVRPLGHRSTYTAILYLEPFDWRNQRAFGYDMFSEPVRRHAMQKAVDTGLAMIAAGVTLVQETDQDVQLGLLMYLPIYRKGMPTDTAENRRRAIQGFSYSPVRVRDLMLGTFSHLPIQLGFELHATSQGTQESLLFSSAHAMSRPSAAGSAPVFTRDQAFDAYGTHWRVRTWTLPAFDSHLNRGTSLAILAAGGSISLLLSLLVHLLNQSRERALASSQRIADSEARYHALFDLGPDAIVLIDPASETFLDVNDQACRQLGYSLEAFSHLTLADLETEVPPDLRRARVKQIMDEGFGEYHTRHRTRLGEPREIHVKARSSSVNGQRVFHCVWRDVTRLKKDERLLQARLHLIEFSLSHSLEALLAETLDQLERLTESQLGFFHFVHEGNGSLTRQAWSTRAKALGDTWPPTSLWQDCLRRRTPVVHHAGFLPLASREYAVLPGTREMAVPIFRGESLVGIVGLAQKPTDYTEEDLALVSHFSDLAWDIADRLIVKQALRERDASLRNQNAFLSTLLEHLDIGVVMVEAPSGKPLIANPQALRLLGLGVLIGPDGAPLGPLHELRITGSRERLAPEASPLHRAMRGEPSHRDDLLVVHPDGSEALVEVFGIPIHDEQGHVWAGLASFHDITDRRRTEHEREQLWAQLMQSQKMESLGTLAGGVAHDMNNVLAAILGLASAHVLAQPEDTPVQRTFQTIIKACSRGGEMVKRLLSFARRRPAEAQRLDLNALLREEIQLLERTTLSRIKVIADLAEDLMPMLGDPSALSHAVMNLCVNAVEAMTGAGTLTLRTQNLSGGWIEVTVEDTGMGMPREVLEKAIDPFFTTKEVGKGTGLGLAMVFSTVKAHSGRLDLQSEPGKGTQVFMQFPACPVTDLGAPEPDPSTLTSPRHRLHILVVDDDELVLESTLELVEAMGHQGTGVPCGEEALARLEAGFRPDAVILDVNMPGLGGVGTLPRLRLLAPTLPVCLATGRVEEAALALQQAHARVLILPKPYTIRELQQALDTLVFHATPA